MKKLLLILGVIVILFVVSFVVLYVVVSNKVQAPPDNTPIFYVEKVKPTSENELLVCIGDSITHGRVSANYVDILAGRLVGQGIDVVNAGINSELAYNVKRRLDYVIRCEPDYVTILIGTNDANGMLTEEKGKKQVKEMGLPQMPTDEWYRENLIHICERLKEETDAKIALLSLPPIGENIGDAAYSKTDEVSEIIKEVAERERVSYLPLHESMTGYLIEQNHTPKLIYEIDNPELVMYKGIFGHFVLKRSFDEIAAKNGFLLLTDFLHLNTTGATIVADLIGDFVLR
jgi:lysophospholipase L1-like esterase